jgi:hypothetical protein
MSDLNRSGNKIVPAGLAERFQISEFRFIALRELALLLSLRLVAHERQFDLAKHRCLCGKSVLYANRFLACASHECEEPKLHTLARMDYGKCLGLALVFGQGFVPTARRPVGATIKGAWTKCERHLGDDLQKRVVVRRYLAEIPRR